MVSVLFGNHGDRRQEWVLPASQLVALRKVGFQQFLAVRAKAENYARPARLGIFGLLLPHTDAAGIVKFAKDFRTASVP